MLSASAQLVHLNLDTSTGNIVQKALPIALRGLINVGDSSSGIAPADIAQISRTLLQLFEGVQQHSHHVSFSGAPEW